MIARFSRRTAVSGAGSLALAACSTLVAPTATARRPLGLANITVAGELRQDYAGTLGKVAAMGYTHFGFPLARMSPQMPATPHPREIARMLRDNGLKVGVVRYGLAAPVAEQLAWAAEIGAETVAYTAAPVFFASGTLGTATRDAFDAWLPELGKLADAAGKAGLTLAYHNHWWDHVPLDGETPLAIIARSYSPRQVAFEIDLAWAQLGGADPFGLVQSLGPRVVSMHFKDVDASRGPNMFDQLVAPGDGDLGYDALIPRLDRLTDAIGYVEVDNPADGLRAAQSGARCIREARNEAID